MAVNDFALCTLTEVKNWLQLSGANATRDRFIEDRIEDISAQIEGYIGDNVVGRMYTEYYSGDGSDTLIVNHRPLNSISTLIDDTDREWDNTQDVISYDDRMIDRKRGKITLWNDESVFNLPDGGQNVKIEYHAGYSLLAININSNDWIDFTLGTTSTSAQIQRDEYDVFALASQIKKEMNDVAGGTYVNVSFSGKTNKYTINLATSGFQTLSLNFASGSHSSYSIATTLGWIKTDKSGATRYTASTPAEPHIVNDLRLAAVRSVAYIYNQSNFGEGREGIKSERIGDYSYNLEDVIANDKSLERTLKRYRRMDRWIG